MERTNPLFERRARECDGIEVKECAKSDGSVSGRASERARARARGASEVSTTNDSKAIGDYGRARANAIDDGVGERFGDEDLGDRIARSSASREDAESNLDDSEEEDESEARANGGRARERVALGGLRTVAARSFVPELVAPARSAPNDGHVMISVSPRATSPARAKDGGRKSYDLGVPSFNDEDGYVNASKSTARRPLLKPEVDDLAAALESSARVSRCDVSDVGSERSSDRSEEFSDDDGGSSWGGSSVGDPIVIEAFSRSRHGRVKELQKLFAQGVNPRVRDGNGLTLLHIACQNNQRRSAKLVLKMTDYKTSPPRLEIINSQTNNGHTPLHFCFAYGYQGLGEYLLSLGASDRIANIHGLSCYEGLEPNEMRETLNNPTMKQRAHESRMQRWIESQRPGAMPEVYARNVDRRGDVPRQRSEPGDYVARSRSASEYSDDRSHASYESFGRRDDGYAPRTASVGHPSMTHGPPPPMPYMPYAMPYSPPMMPMHPMYMQYPGMPPAMHHGAYDDRGYRSPPRRRRSRDRSRSRSRSRSRRRDRDASRDYDRRPRDRDDRDREYDRRRTDREVDDRRRTERDIDERRRTDREVEDRRDIRDVERSTSRRSSERERNSRKSSKARSLGDRSDDGASSLGSDGGGYARRSPRQTTPSRSRRKPAKVDVLEAMGTVDVARKKANVFDSEDDDA